MARRVLPEGFEPAENFKGGLSQNKAGANRENRTEEERRPRSASWNAAEFPRVRQLLVRYPLAAV